MRICRLMLLTLLLVLPAVATAQERERERIEAAGTLRSAGAGVLQMATDSNEVLTVKLPMRAAEITFSGNAEASFLKPGMLVKFSAVIGKRGQIADPIKSLVIFTPVERTDLGIWPEGAESGAPNPLENLFTNPEAKSSPKKGKKKIVEDQPYQIGGTLTSLKGNKLTVTAGGTQLKCELADDAKIRVSVGHLNFAQVGDKVELEGWHYQGMRQAVYANRVSVTAVNTLEGEKKGRPKSEEKDEPKEATEDNE